MLTYLPVIAPVIAIINSVIAVYATQFKPEDGRTKVALLSIAIALGCVASGATIWSQYNVQRKEAQEKASRKNTRERLAAYISASQTILSALRAEGGDHNAAKVAANSWYADASAYLLTLGPEYVSRFNNDTGLSPISPNGVTDDELRGYWIGVYYRTVRLEQFMTEMLR